MKDWPNSGWAAVFILLACALAVAALFSRSANSTAVITMASSIITGAFGYIQGKKDAESTLQTPPPGIAQSTTTTTSTIPPPTPPVIPIAPAEPAKP
jgi:hypothetical protein